MGQYLPQEKGNTFMRDEILHCVENDKVEDDPNLLL
jgi:hypothetical protein